MSNVSETALKDAIINLWEKAVRNYEEADRLELDSMLNPSHKVENDKRMYALLREADAICKAFGPG